MLRATRRAETAAARSATAALCHAQVILGLIHRIGLVKHVCHRRPEGVRNNAAHACKSDIRAGARDQHGLLLQLWLALPRLLRLSWLLLESLI